MRIRTVSLVVIVALVAIGCSSDAEPTAETNDQSVPESTPESTEASAVDTTPDIEGPAITIEGFAFSALEPVGPGTEISVINLDGTQHTLTADDGSFNTGGLDGGNTAVITAPDAPGTYSFVCNIHPTMTGSITVEG